MSGVLSEGLRSTALPAAKAGPTLWQTVLSGALKGVMAATRPSGTRMAKPIRSAPPGAPSKGTSSPSIRLASSAESVSVWSARAISPSASLTGKPASATSVSRKAPSRSATRSRTRWRMAARA